MLGIQPKSDPNQFFCSHAFLFFTMLFVACVAGVDRGRGRGNLGARESVWGALGRNSPSGAPKFPLPLLLSTPATQAEQKLKNCLHQKQKVGSA